MFQKPQALDLTATITEKTPDDWKQLVGPDEREQMTFLPVSDTQRQRSDGWCTYAEHIGDSPEIEILCGGMNHKLPSAAAVWRQGNLLHFGFQEDPSDLNHNGKKLLENCIVYIAGFVTDRPLVHSPSPFVDADYPKPRRYVARAIERGDAEPAAIARNFAEPWSGIVAALDAAGLQRWWREAGDYVCAADGGKLALDANAKSLGMAFGRPEFFTRAQRALGNPNIERTVVEVLAARVPDGPGAGASADAWRAFLAENQPYLFFSEEGGQHWHLDPLAKARGVPCQDLRGPARAGR